MELCNLGSNGGHRIVFLFSLLKLQWRNLIKENTVLHTIKTHIIQEKEFAKINLTKLATGFAGFFFFFQINALYFSVRYLQYSTSGKNMHF